MRGRDRQRGHLGGYVNPEARVPQDHPLRQIRPLVDAALTRLSPLFDELYSPIGRPSIPPEHLLRASLLQAFFTIRSERQLMEQLSYNLLFRWFVGLPVEAEVWDVRVFTKNRERLLEGDVAHEFLRAVLADPQVRALLSDEHFSVDGTLIEAWARLAEGSARQSLVEWPDEGSMKSFRRKDSSDEPPGPGRNSPRDFRGEKLSNETHASTTDPDARLYKKAPGAAARLCHRGHAVMENRSCLVVETKVTQASGTAEAEAATAMVGAMPGQHRITVGADKLFDTSGFVADMRALNVTPHVAQNDTGRASAIDGRTTRHPGYTLSLILRKRIEEAFGWIKTIGGQAKTHFRGTPRVDWMFTLAAAAYDLIRLPKLLAAAA
jgi:transposase